jgi:hypothetical protein
MGHVGAGRGDRGAGGPRAARGARGGRISGSDIATDGNRPPGGRTGCETLVNELEGCLDSYATRADA